MEVGQTAIAQKLRQFKIRNVRVEEPFEIGSNRFEAKDVLIPIRGRILLGCTDERPIKDLLDPKTGQRLDLSQYTVARAAGAAFGLVDAVRNVRVTIDRVEILSALSENEVVMANHIDTHADEGRLTGCGYGALRELPQSGSVFDRPSVAVEERAGSFEEMGTLRMVLDGEHTAAGLIVNPFSDKVLEPTNEVAQHSFFSLDLGVYREIVHWIEGALAFGEESAHSILVKLARNTLTAVFILARGTINEAVFVERNDDQDSVYAGILHEALAELKERGASVIHMMEAR